tara:strand:- start:2271 stop:4502 length:2232 start_codon:yes stop_codon:yes gene_type:complete
MAINQVFKGDLAEVSLGKETGLIGHATGSWVDGTTTTDGWKTVKVGPTANTSTIHVGEGMYWVDTSGNMLVPKNMLVGATLRFTDASGNHQNDHYPTTKRSYTITANDADTITIQPRLASADNPGTADAFFTIFGLRVPTFDSAMTATSDERVKTDQFLGLLNSFTLPEPELDVRKQHIVGMGRDVNVLTTGKETLAGGAYDLNAHSLRFLKYGLGGHTAKSMGEYANVASANTIVGALPLNLKTTMTKSLAAQEFGTSTVDATITATSGTTVSGLGSTVGSDVLIGALSVADTGTDITTTDQTNTVFDVVTAGGIFKVLSADGVPLLGHYTTYGGAAVLGGCTDIDSGALARAQTVDIPIYVLVTPAANITAGDLRINLGATTAAKFSAGDYIQIFDKDTVQIPGADVTAPTLNKHEIRRVLAVGSSDGADAEYVYVEEPFLFGHTATSCGVERLQYTWDSANSVAWERGSPAIISGTNELKYGVEHNFFGYSYLPTFSLEQSFRQTDITPGAEQLLRVFSGCKVNALTLKADSEGEVKISGDYEAGRMFTDTESKFITPHRMFENTANSQVNRRVSGIAVDGEKPYLFQHISMEAFGAPLLRATAAEFGITNTNTARWYIKGTDGAYSDTDQVQEGATQYATEITEAAREYTFKFSALVEDSRWFDELRKRKHHINTNDITMTMIKPGSASTRQNALITIEDYTVTKAAHPMPDDKGPVTAEVEFAVRHIKAKETNPYFIL